MEGWIETWMSESFKTTACINPVSGMTSVTHHSLRLFTQNLTMETDLEAVNGRQVRAIEVFGHALRFFREHALKVDPPSR